MIFITAYAQDEFWQQFVERNDQPQTLRKFTFNVQFRYFPWQELFHSITVHHFPHIWANFVSFFMHPFVHLPAPQNEESCNTYSLSSRRKNLIHKARFFSENCAYIYTQTYTRTYLAFFVKQALQIRSQHVRRISQALPRSLKYSTHLENTQQL